MVWWNTKHAIAQWRSKGISFLDFAIFSALLALIIGWHLTPATLVPWIYTLSMGGIKKYLVHEIGNPAAIITVHHTPSWLFTLNYSLIIVGILFVFLADEHSFLTSLKRIAALSWLCIVRLVVISVIFFCTLLGLVCIYYGYKLTMIAHQEAPEGPTLLRPIKYIFKFFGGYESVKELWANIFRLAKAEKVLKEINQWSSFFWHTSILLSTSTSAYLPLYMRSLIKQI